MKLKVINSPGYRTLLDLAESPIQGKSLIKQNSDGLPDAFSWSVNLLPLLGSLLAKAQFGDEC